MVDRNKIFSFKIKRQAKKNIFPSDVVRTVDVVISLIHSYVVISQNGSQNGISDIANKSVIFEPISDIAKSN